MSSLGGIASTIPDPPRYPPVSYLEGLTPHDQDEIIAAVGYHLPLQARRDAFEVVWHRAYERSSRLGILSEVHHLAHPHPRGWLVRAAKNEVIRELTRRGALVPLTDESQLAGPSPNVVEDLIKNEVHAARRATAGRLASYLDELPEQDRVVFVAARKTIAVLIDELPTGVSHALNLLRLDQIADPARRLTNNQIAAVLDPLVREAAGTVAEKHGQRARKQHLAGRERLFGAIAGSRPPAPSPAGIPFVDHAWQTIRALPDPSGKALALHVFGELAIEIDGSPDRTSDILSRCELTLQDDETVRWMAVGVTARPDAVLSVAELGEWARHRDRDVRARLRQRFLLDGCDPEVLATLGP